MGLEIFFALPNLKYILCLLSTIAGIFVISTKNAIISVFNLIVLYILVAFYLIYIGITYLGISYIVVYIGAIAILFLFVIMMIDIEVVDKRVNNYLPLLLFLLGGFLFLLRKILFNIGNLKIKSFLYSEENKYFVDSDHDNLFNLSSHNNSFGNIDFNDNLLISSNKTLSDNYDLFNNFIFSSDTDGNKLDGIFNNNIEFKDTSLIFDKLNISSDLDSHNYLLFTPDWNSALNRVTQISAIGDVLYTTYHSFIYIVSVILLLAMVGAIILTADHNQEVKTITIMRNKNKASNILAPLFILKDYIITSIQDKNNIHFECNKLFSNLFLFINKFITDKKVSLNIYKFSFLSFYSFSDLLDNEKKHSENILGSLPYYVFITVFIGVLLLLINSSFSLSVKYLEKGGGFECGFTSFLQTRERYNIIFYRVSLLFLVFDLEIILAFPYPAIYQKNQNSSKNNVLAFLYILVIGFIYELKEGALNIVKTAHSTEVKVDY